MTLNSNSQSELSRSTAAEEANASEIHRLSASAASLQAELAFRPTRADVDDLAGVIESLREQLAARDRQLQRAPTHDKACSTDLDLGRDLANAERPAPVSAESPLDAGKISAEIDEMFRLDYDEDDDESDSAATEIDGVTEAAARAEPGPAAAAAEYVRLDDDERLQVTVIMISYFLFPCGMLFLLCARCYATN